jgi:hypothetical protein
MDRNIFAFIGATVADVGGGLDRNGNSTNIVDLRVVDLRSQTIHAADEGSM